MQDNVGDEDDVFPSNEYCRTSEQRRTLNHEFIRKLARDYIHFKLFGNDGNDSRFLQRSKSKKKATRQFSQEEKSSFKKAKTVLRRTSSEMQRENPDFFETVIPDTKPETAKLAFRIISEEVLDPDKLNWGRVISLFVYGGILAEEFWRSQQEDKVDEVEEWLTESLVEREDWIEKRGGWDDFSATFTREEPAPYSWITLPAIVAAGVMLLGLLSMKVLQ